MLEHRYGTSWRKNLILHETEVPESEMKIALSLIERWGAVAADDDGEDSRGRQKLKLQAPKDLVERCFEVAACAMRLGREKRLILDIGHLPSEEQPKIEGGQTKE